MLAGTVTFLATIGMWSALGPAGLVVAPLGTYLFVAVLLCGTVSETSLTLAWSLRAALVVTVVLMDVTGLLLLWPVAGGVVAGVVGLCSPPVTGLLASGGRRPRPPVDRPARPELDQAEVDRIFADIVSGF